MLINNDELINDSSSVINGHLEITDEKMTFGDWNIPWASVTRAAINNTPLMDGHMVGLAIESTVGNYYFNMAKGALNKEKLPVKIEEYSEDLMGIKKYKKLLVRASILLVVLSVILEFVSRRLE